MLLETTLTHVALSSQLLQLTVEHHLRLLYHLLGNALVLRVHHFLRLHLLRETRAVLIYARHVQHVHRRHISGIVCRVLGAKVISDSSIELQRLVPARLQHICSIGSNAFAVGEVSGKLVEDHVVHVVRIHGLDQLVGVLRVKNVLDVLFRDYRLGHMRQNKLL